MNIRIWDDKYIIKSDARQYILLKVVESEEGGEETESAIAYCNSMAHVFKCLTEREGRLNKCTTLEGYVKHIEKINKKLEAILQAIAEASGAKENLFRIVAAAADEVPEKIDSLTGELPAKKKTTAKKTTKKAEAKK